MNDRGVVVFCRIILISKKNPVTCQRVTGLLSLIMGRKQQEGSVTVN